MNMKVDGNNYALERFSTEAAHIDAGEIRRKPLDASQSYAQVITDDMLDSLHGSGTAVTLRKPNSAASMPVKELQSEVEKLLAQPDIMQDLTRLAEGGVKKDSAKEFDVSKLNISIIADLMARLLESAQKGNIAEKMNKSSMLKLQGDTAVGVADAMRNAGAAALRDSFSQAGVGLTVAGAGFAMQRKGLNQERAVLQNDQPKINQKQFDLDDSRLNMKKDDTKNFETATNARSSQLRNEDGQNIHLKPDNPTVSESHRAHNEEGIGLHARQKEIDDLGIDMRDKSLKAEDNRNKGLAFGQLNHPMQGIMSGQAQVNQANENAQQHLQQQTGQVAAGGVESSNANARDFENLLQTILQKLVDIQRAHIETASMVASKSA